MSARVSSEKHGNLLLRVFYVLRVIAEGFAAMEARASVPGGPPGRVHGLRGAGRAPDPASARVSRFGTRRDMPLAFRPPRVVSEDLYAAAARFDKPPAANQGCRSATPSPSMCVVSRQPSATLAEGQGGGRSPANSGVEPVATAGRWIPPHRGPGASTLAACESRRGHHSMAFRYRIVPWLEIFFMEIEGEVSGEEMRASIEALHADPLYHSELGRLIDVRQITSLPASDELREFARLALAGGARRRTRRAVLVDSDVANGLARMLEAYSAEGPTEYRPFRSHEHALQWLVTTEQDP